MASLKAVNVTLDRKMLSEIAVSEPKAFEAVAKIAQK